MLKKSFASLRPYAEQVAILQPPVLANDLYFGNSVSISGDGTSVVVGEIGGNNAHVYDRSGLSWSHTATLNTPGTGDFGHAVSMISEGDRILVGAPTLNTTGEAYYYIKSGGSWTNDGTVPKLETSGANRYGYSVSLIRSDSLATPRAAIGIPYYNSPYGRATQRIRDGSDASWSGGILTLDTATSDRYGWSVAQSAVESDRFALVGAPYTNSVQTQAGAAFVETFGSGEVSLIPADLTAYSYFGWSVAITPDATTALVGAPNEGSNFGAVYVYTRSGYTWTQQAKLTPSTRYFNGSFGYSVSISHDGNLALIGSPGASVGFVPATSGRIYYFSRTGSTWTEEASYSANTGDQFSVFGQSVSLSADGNYAIVGSWLSYWPSYSYTNIGAAFIFSR